MIVNLTAVRRTVLVALVLFALALGGALIAGAQGLTGAGPGHVLGAASLLGDPDDGGE